LRIILDIILVAGNGTCVKLPGQISQRLAASGIRLTKQREQVLGVLMQKPDHPTATEVFLRTKKHVSSISLGTVYNCLEALVATGLVKQVNLDRAPTRYCANLLEHSHFFCERCGSVHDVSITMGNSWELPPGFRVSHADVNLRGTCPKCSE
jgi:Fur family peroxide stress response transcriptional regulator